MLLIAILFVVTSLAWAEHKYFSSVVTMETLPREIFPLRNSLSFFVVGDIGGSPTSLHSGNYSAKKELATQLGVWAQDYEPSFIVGVGDNFYDLGVTSIDDPEWDDQFESVYTAEALLDIPWLMTLGNHDYVREPEAQIERTKQYPEGRWQMPDRAYSRKFVHPGDQNGGDESFSVEIFSIDTIATSFTLTPETRGRCNFGSPFPGCSPRFEVESTRIISWLEESLMSSTANWKIVAGHFPLFSVGHHGSGQETAALRAVLLPLFHRYGVDLYVSGHDHIAQHIVSERAIDHVTLGTSGPKVMDGTYDLDFVGPNGRGEWEAGGGEGEVGSGRESMGFGQQKVEREERNSVREREGSELKYVSKRTAFGVFEANNDSLRVSLVGGDGKVLYNFARSG